MDGETDQQKRRHETRLHGFDTLTSPTTEGPTMSAPDDSGPAFPSQNGHYFEPGMTLRDWFAGQALAGIWACPTVSGDWHDLADEAYKTADAMIAARNTLP